MVENLLECPTHEQQMEEGWVSVLLPVAILLGAGLIIRLKVPAGNCGMSDMEETFGASKKKARGLL